MQNYAPPLGDMGFVLTQHLATDETDAETIHAVLEEAGKLASNVFAPLNWSGNLQGARLENGVVRTPDGFREAYQAYVDGGWNALAFPESIGGQGLSNALAMAVQEMWQASNIGLALCPLLNQGAIELLSHFGSAEQKRLYLPKLVTGEWTGTMNLTEPQAGSDVGAVRCKAIRTETGYKLVGQKIYISYGDHDMADNIIHFVLARTDDAPEGTKGLSLFLVPKIRVNADGTLGSANDVKPISLEHKLGQHGGPTCVMQFGDGDGAHAEIVGEERGGIAGMFVMMNNARLGVGLQGLGLCERAYQQAVEYAKDRVQGKDIAKPQGTNVPILRHPDVRRMLLSMQSRIAAARALAYTAGRGLDELKDNAKREKAQARVDLLTPLVKGWLTDLANEVTSLNIQIHGGMGYIEETGAAQHYRDARVLAIYEGTNGIQANDLVFRKIARDGGAAIRAFVEDGQNAAQNLARQTGDDAARLAKTLAATLKDVEEAAAFHLGIAKSDPRLAAAGAAPTLKLVSLAAGGIMLAQQAIIVLKALETGGPNAAGLDHRLLLARFYAENILPETGALLRQVRDGSSVIGAVNENLF